MRRHRFLSFAFAALLGLTAGALSWLAAASDARAAFILSMDADGTCATDGTDCAVYIVDGGVEDTNADAGVIEFSGDVGNFETHITTGTSKPAIGSALEPRLALESVDVSSDAGGTLTIKLTDTEFSSGDGDALANWITTIEGETFGSEGETLSFQVFVNTDNESFSTTGTLIADIGPLTGPSFDEIRTAMAQIDGAFSVTLIATITHEAGIQGTNFTAQVSDPLPEPGTLGMFGIGLIGLGLFWRRRWKMELAAQHGADRAGPDKNTKK